MIKCYAKEVLCIKKGIRELNQGWEIEKGKEKIPWYIAPEEGTPVYETKEELEK